MVETGLAEATAKGHRPCPPLPEIAHKSLPSAGGPVTLMASGRAVEPGNTPVVGTPEDIRRKVVVAEALRTLSPAHRQVLNETILRGRTVNAAAAALGIPVGTVKARVYYALHALRVALAERECQRREW